MRFHHSTRRGRNNGRSERREPTSNTSRALLDGSSKWSQLAYCRESNIYFERRQLVPPPKSYQETSGWQARKKVAEEGGAIKSLSYQIRLNTGSGLAETLDKNKQEVEQQDGLLTPAIRPIGSDKLAPVKPLNMEQVREKLLVQVEKRPFWSNKAARRMQLLGSEQRLIYIYELVSFCEMRELKWHFEPNKGSSSRTAAAAGAGANKAGSSSPCVGGSSHLRASSHALTQSRLVPPRPLSAAGVEHLQSHPQEQVSCARVSSAGSMRNSAGTRNELTDDYVWSIEPSFQPEPFVNHFISSELPDTSFVKGCHGCQGRGRLKCNSCHGVGHEVCLSCSGAGTTRSLAAGKSASRSSERSKFNSSSNKSGADDDSDDSGWKSSKSRKDAEWYSSSSTQASAWASESCSSCHGSGRKKCWACSGRSYNSCPACRGAGSLRCYQSLDITWTNHRDEQFLNNSDNIITKDRLRLCSGQVLADQQAAHLEPLKLALASDGATNATSQQEEPTTQARKASQQLLDRHRMQHKSERLIRQRHKLTQIECHIIRYEWKKRRGQFVVYGEEHKVYIDKYPFKSICNIT